MKILKYNHFMLRESFIDTPNTANDIQQYIQTLENGLAQLNQYEEQIGMLDDEDFDELIEVFEKQPMPKSVKEVLINTFLVMRHEDMRNMFKELYKMAAEKARKCNNLQELKDDQDIKIMGDKITEKMAKILNKSKDELDSLTNQFMGGMKSFQDSSANAKKVSDADPYGEEAWDNMSDRDRLYQAFGEEAPPDELDDI